MKIIFDGENITTNVKIEVGDIRNITVEYLPKKNKYSVFFEGSDFKHETKQYTKVQFEGVDFEDVTHRFHYPKYLSFMASNGKYINYYPEGTK
jgi:hypothetical protein